MALQQFDYKSRNERVLTNKDRRVTRLYVIEPEPDDPIADVSTIIDELFIVLQQQWPTGQ